MLTFILLIVVIVVLAPLTTVAMFNSPKTYMPTSAEVVKAQHGAPTLVWLGGCWRDVSRVSEAEFQDLEAAFQAQMIPGRSLRDTYTALVRYRAGEAP